MKICEWVENGPQSPAREKRDSIRTSSFQYQKDLQPFQPILKHFTFSIKKQYIISSNNWILGVQATCKFPLKILGVSFSSCIESACSVLHPTSFEEINYWSGQEMRFEVPLIHLALLSFIFSLSVPEKKYTPGIQELDRGWSNVTN